MAVKTVMVSGTQDMTSTPVGRAELGRRKPGVGICSACVPALPPASGASELPSTETPKPGVGRVRGAGQACCAPLPQGLPSGTPQGTGKGRGGSVSGARRGLELEPGPRAGSCHQEGTRLLAEQ